MISLQTPGVYFFSADPPPAVNALRTDIAAFVGIAERGALHAPTPVQSWEQFQSRFGGFLAAGYLAYSVKAFFENGGRTAYIVRVAAPETHPQGPVAANGTLLGLNGQPTLTISAESPGVWGDTLAARVGRSPAAATRLVRAPQPASPDYSYVESITGFRIGTLARLFQEQSPVPLTTHRTVIGVDAAQRRLQWDAPLDPGYDLTASATDPTRLATPISLETLEFTLTTLWNGRVREVFGGLSLNPLAGDDHFVETVLWNRSNLIRAAVIAQAQPWEARFPDGQAANLQRGLLALQNGRDGIAVLTPEDYIGDLGSVARWGIRTLELVPNVSLLAVPDIHIRPIPPPATDPLPPPPAPNPCLPGTPPVPVAPPVAVAMEQPPQFTLDQILRVQQALVAHCELMKYRFALIDPPLPLSPAEDVALDDVQVWRQNFDTKQAALYFPWTLVPDPLRLQGNLLRATPPSGHVAGLIARTDAEIGVHKAPANAELRWLQGLTVEIGDEVQGILNPVGINCLRPMSGRGLRVYGARTVSSDPSWRFVNVRRLFLMIEQALEIALQWSVFEPNDLTLRHKVNVAISGFLSALWKKGMLTGGSTDEAYYVHCNAQNNPPEVTEAGQLIIEIGVAPTFPAEFVVFRIGRTEEELSIQE